MSLEEDLISALVKQGQLGGWGLRVVDLALQDDPDIAAWLQSVHDRVVVALVTMTESELRPIVEPEARRLVQRLFYGEH